jgi:hypothetical protein
MFHRCDSIQEHAQSLAERSLSLYRRNSSHSLHNPEQVLRETWEGVSAEGLVGLAQFPNSRIELDPAYRRSARTGMPPRFLPV